VDTKANMGGDRYVILWRVTPSTVKSFSFTKMTARPVYLEQYEEPSCEGIIGNER
jgi:hypothetical protein